MKYIVIKDITDTPVSKDGKYDRITIPAGTECDVKDTIMSRMGGETDIVSCTIDGVFYDNIHFPTSWSKKDEFGEGPYIELLPDKPVPDGGRKRHTKKRHTKKRHTKKYKKNKKTKRFRRRN